MKKRSLTKVIICLMSAALLAGCGESSDINLKDKLEDVKEKAEQVETVDTQKPEKKEKEEEKEEVSQDSPLPEVCIVEHMGRKENGDLVVEDRYDQIELKYEDDTYNDLSEKLNELNKVVESEHNKTDNPLGEGCRIFLRRDDRQVFSVVCEYREYKEEIDGVRTRGYSYLTDSGKELELSDIVDDEEEFFNRLANILSVEVTNKMMVITDEFMEPEDMREDLKNLLDSGEYGWVVDPQGVTFWFDRINAVLGNVTATVLFADDADGTIFNKDFVTNAPDEWIMQIPGDYSRTCFDREDDGMIDTISWTLSQTSGDDAMQYPSGIDVCINGRNYLSDEIIESYGGMFYGTIAMLVHKDKQTYFMTYYCEEAEPSFVTLSLKDDTVKRSDAKYVYIDRDGDGEYVPTDPSAIRVYSDHGGDEMTEYPPEIMSMDSDGMLTVREVSR